MKTNKKLLASAMALGLAALTTVGSTYAWFTTNGSASVKGIEMTAASGDNGILITDGKETGVEGSGGKAVWSDKIDFAMEDVTLAPVTSVDGKTFFTLGNTVGDKFQNYTNADTTKGTAGVVANGTFAYTALDLTAEGATKYVVDKKIYVAVDASTTKLNIKTEFKAKDAAKTEILSAGRVAIIVNDKDVADDAVFSLGGEHGTADDALSLYEEIYNDMAGVADFVKVAGTNTGKTDWTKTDDEVYDVDAMAATGYTITLADADKAATVSALAVKTAYLRETTDQNAALTGFNYLTITLRFWVEGNDRKCYNALAEQTFTGTVTISSSLS